MKITDTFSFWDSSTARDLWLGVLGAEPDYGDVYIAVDYESPTSPMTSEEMYSDSPCIYGSFVDHCGFHSHIETVQRWGRPLCGLVDGYFPWRHQIPKGVFMVAKRLERHGLMAIEPSKFFCLEAAEAELHAMLRSDEKYGDLCGWGVFRIGRVSLAEEVEQRTPLFHRSHEFSDRTPYVVSLAA